MNKIVTITLYRQHRCDGGDIKAVIGDAPDCLSSVTIDVTCAPVQARGADFASPYAMVGYDYTQWVARPTGKIVYPGDKFNSAIYYVPDDVVAALVATDDVQRLLRNM